MRAPYSVDEIDVDHHHHCAVPFCRALAEGRLRVGHLIRITATASLTRAICCALASLIQRGWREMSIPLRAIALLMRAMGAYTVPSFRIFLLNGRCLALRGLLWRLCASLPVRCASRDPCD